jgi:branched-chain amino acid transport system permease protein
VADTLPEQPEQIARSSSPPPWLHRNLAGAILLLTMVALPFLAALLDGQSLASLLANEPSPSKFIQGLAIEIFILAAYALSYDLILGVTGLLSFGHAMFFAVGAYLTGIMLKSFHWSFGATLGLVIVAAVIQAILFAVVLPRVKGITFALVTLGMASVFYIVIQSQELIQYTGADVGLQGVVPPPFLNSTNNRLTFYFISLVFLVLVYLFYRRFVNSPTGRVCVALRENEERTRMLGYNTFYFKLITLIIASLTAALAGCLYTLHQPIVTPTIASLQYTVTALLIILIGGIGTLSGAIIGAAIYRLLDYGLTTRLGGNSTFIIGGIYVAIVLFLPYGIVGTWQLRKLDILEGRKRLLRYFTGGRGLTKKEN